MRGRLLVTEVVVEAILLPVFVIITVTMYRIPQCYASTMYVLEEDEAVVNRRVWWKTRRCPTTMSQVLTSNRGLW